MMVPTISRPSSLVFLWSFRGTQAVQGEGTLLRPGDGLGLAASPFRPSPTTRTTTIPDGATDASPPGLVAPSHSARGVPKDRHLLLPALAVEILDHVSPKIDHGDDPLPGCRRDGIAALPRALGSILDRTLEAIDPGRSTANRPAVLGQMRRQERPCTQLMPGEEEEQWFLFRPLSAVFSRVELPCMGISSGRVPRLKTPW